MFQNNYPIDLLKTLFRVKWGKVDIPVLGFPLVFKFISSEKIVNQRFTNPFLKIFTAYIYEYKGTCF